MRTFCLILYSLLPIVSGLGSMSSIAISYGENGPAFCGIKSDGSHLATCYGSNSAVTYGTPRFAFTGLTAGDGFVCGLLMDSAQPYCWGISAYIKMGVPQPMVDNAEFTEISAGDYHLCGLRKPIMPKYRTPFFSIVDCWGYNMTKTFVLEGEVHSISAGSDFNCGIFSQNRSAFCWGDETSSHVMRLTPKYQKFQKIAAGGYHVCGILESSRVFCWGRSLDLDKEFSVNDLPPNDPMLAIVGGKFHACGIRSLDRGVTCWGFIVKPSTPAPTGVKVYELAAGNYFTCGLMAEPSMLPLCWGVGFPTSLPVAISAGVCSSLPCASGSYELTADESPCKLPGSHVCVPCSDACPAQMHLASACTSKSDRVCEYNCSSCVTPECFSNCSTSRHVGNDRKFWALQLPVLIAETSFVVLLVIIVFATAVLYVRNKLKDCRCSVATRSSGSRGPKRVRPGIDEMKIRRAHMYTYEELAQATEGFKEESLVGKGSFSCVYKGVLKDGTVVAVKKAIVNSDKQKNSKEFHNELDLLSRLNHAHLLNLLGYCEESGERLLVYEFMANGSLHQHLHGKKTVLDWVRRATIAVQAARGIEYLHGYACPPVIHRDIKSSNILIDEEHNARVADFGLSLMGPADSGSPLAELPAGTLGYLDPEYYRLHYLTTKSDVYSFGVLLLELLSGRKAIDMQYEEGNIVEWAVPLIKAGDVAGVLDVALEAPSDMEALTRIAHVACRCVRMRGKDRPSMDKVTTALERALAQLMGGSILPTEVVLGSSRLHKKSSSNRSNEGAEFRAPSWITFPSVTLSSSQRRKSSASEADMQRICGSGDARRLNEEIGPASPRENLFLQHNF